MEITIIHPLTISMPDGPQNFKGGETITLPDPVGRRLLALAPGRVQKVTDAVFSVGQRVQYRIPTHIESPIDYLWEEFVGQIELIDRARHLALIIPEGELLDWLWVSLTYVKTVPDAPAQDGGHNEKGSS